MLEFKGSAAEAVSCAKRASDCNATYVDWKIILCRVLLDAMRDPYKAETKRVEDVRVDRAMSRETLIEEDPDPEEILTSSLEVCS